MILRLKQHKRAYLESEEMKKKNHQPSATGAQGMVLLFFAGP